ncbi:MAG TPA: hypothetical protein VH331_08425 [Allosphingosinicella sp.]|nr:hypothetical protein [Allosphingosinicella sp.]
MTAAWLAKPMDRDERLDFIRRFQDHHASAGSPADSALFMRRDSSECRPILLLPPGHETVAETLSPGGWEGCGKPATSGWIVIVGHPEALLRFGILV